MKRKSLSLLILCHLSFLLALAPPALADAFRLDGFRYSDDVTIVGLADGSFRTVIKGATKNLDITHLDWIHLDKYDALNKAEDARSNPKVAAPLYQKALQEISEPALKLLVQLRLSALLDSPETFTDATAAFLSVYQAAPFDDVWKLRPTNVPTRSSLKESAALIQSKIPSFKSDAQSNLKAWALQLLLPGGDPGAAALEKDLGANARQLAAATTRSSRPAAVKVNVSSTPTTRPLPSKGGPVKFLTLETKGARIVYIVNFGGSMLDASEALSKSLQGSVNALTDDQFFEVIRVNADEATSFFRKLQPANDEFKKKCADLLKQKVAGFSGDPLDGFELAFKRAFQQEPETIIFITDSHLDPRLIQSVLRLNRAARVRIHTIAFLNHDPSYKDQLRELAKANGGQYKFISEKDLTAPQPPKP